MGRLYLYARGNGPTWYIGGFPSGKKQRSTGLVGPEAKKLAERLRANEQAALDALVAKSGPIGPMTVARWKQTWVERLRAEGRDAADKYDALMEQHVLPVIGRVLLAELAEDHVLAVLRATSGERAQRTRLQIFTVMKRMLGRAVPKHMPSNPCLLIERDQPLMPKNVDHDPMWRAKAKFLAEEVELLIFDPRVPWDRRMFYAIAFCTGMRSGEISALRWEAYQPGVKPLGQLLVAYSYKADKKKTKGTKTGGTREVPVIPILAELIGEWTAPGGGWSLLTGRAQPGPGDLMVPTERGTNRNTHTTLELFYDDLRRLGIPPRHVHDSRRTFISLCIDEGGSKEMLRWITHGRPKQDAFDEYSVPAWKTICAQASLFPLVRPVAPAEAVPLRKYANSGDEHLQPTDTTSQVADNTGESWSAARFARSPAGEERRGAADDPGGNPHESRGVSAEPSEPEGVPGPHVCRFVSAVSAARAALERGAVDEALAILRGASR